MDGVAEHGPDLGPAKPVQAPEQKDGGADGGHDEPRDRRRDGGVGQERRDDDEGERDDPEDRRDRPRVQFRPARPPVLVFAVRQIQEADADEDCRSLSILLAHPRRSTLFGDWEQEEREGKPTFDPALSVHVERRHERIGVLDAGPDDDDAREEPVEEDAACSRVRYSRRR